jgi:hypothetical protein
MSRARMHEETQASKPKAMPDKKPTDGVQKESSSESIEDVVGKHGPAHEMHYTHDKASNKHKVNSKHGEEGHEHNSEHDTPEDAMDHMHKAAGAQDDEENEDEEFGEEAGEEMPEMQQASSGRHGHIPGL